MNYQRIYNQLIEKRKNDPANLYGYAEKHHIIPKCMGGTNKKSNLVYLTSREHFLAHWLLHLIHPNNYKLLAAWNAFSLNQCGKRSSSKHQEKCKLKWIEKLKTRPEWDNEWHQKWTLCAKGKIWINNKEKNKRIDPNELDEYIKNGWVTGRLYFERTHSEDHKKKISKANKGRPSKLKGKTMDDLPNLKFGSKIMRYTRVSNGDYFPKNDDLEIIELLKQNNFLVFDETKKRFVYNRKSDKNLLKTLIN